MRPEMITDGTPEGEEISVEVHRLYMGWSGGPSGMRTEHLMVWKRDVTQEKDANTRKCEKLVNVKKAGVLITVHTKRTDKYNNGTNY